MTRIIRNSITKLNGSFTLLELLVVISIITLLLSILMPALGKVKENTKAVLCQNNQKQMGLFFHMYADQNDEQLIQILHPGWNSVRPQTNFPVRWADRLFYDERYVDSSEVFYCPASKVPTGNTKKWPAEYEFGVGTFDTHAELTYGLRGKGFSGAEGGEPIKLSKLKSPSTYLILTDVAMPSAIPGNSGSAPIIEGSHYYMFSSWTGFFMVHKRGVNVLRADMSVEVYKVEDLVGVIPQQGMSWVTPTFPTFLYPDGEMRDLNGDLTTY